MYAAALALVELGRQPAVGSHLAGTYVLNASAEWAEVCRIRT
jgi:hypothetical protein